MELIGHKTTALLDLWSVCHFFAGIAISNIAFRVRRIPTLSRSQYENGIISAPLLLILTFAYGWELLELGLESGFAGQQVAYWFQGQENWFNRLFSDPLLVLGGYLLGERFQPLVWPARIVLIAWLSLFVFIFPHSMAYI